MENQENIFMDQLAFFMADLDAWNAAEVVRRRNLEELCTHLRSAEIQLKDLQRKFELAESAGIVSR
jgi:hypothetical protein